MTKLRCLESLPMTLKAEQQTSRSLVRRSVLTTLGIAISIAPSSPAGKKEMNTFTKEMTKSEINYNARKICRWQVQQKDEHRDLGDQVPCQCKGVSR